MKAKKILWIIVFNLVIIISELVFGVLANSFALIADALHNVGDVIAIVITYIAIKVATQKPSYKKTFGFMRAEMMAGFVNTLFLFLTMFYMIYEASFRLMHPEKVEPLYMIFVGIIAVLANGVSAYMLHQIGVSSCATGNNGEHGHHHEHKEDSNIKSAYLHMLADALISVGVVIAGIFIYFFDVYRIDAILTIVFSIYILFHSFSLLKRSFYSLMDFNMGNVDKEQLEQVIFTNSLVSGYSDLHIYQPSSNEQYISMILLLKESSISLEKAQNIMNELKHNLKHLGFTHSIVELSSKQNMPKPK